MSTISSAVSLPPKSGWPWTKPVSAPTAQPVKELPTISIITPSFNQGQYLEETILSIINQDYPHYELIIIDGGSSDTTLEVISKYEPWITYWVSEPDRGQSHAIQKGLARVSGDIVNWINSDDLVAPGAFQQLAIEFDPLRYDVICGRCDYFLDDISRPETRGMRMALEATVGDTLKRYQINQPSTFFKTAVLKELGVDEQFRYTMDMDLWFRYLLQAGQARVKLSEGLFSYFRLHEASKTVAEGDRFGQDIQKVFYNILFSSGQEAVLLESVRSTITSVAGFVPTHYKVAVPVEELATFVRHQAWLAMHRYREAGNYTAARQCLALARAHGQPLNWATLKQLVRLSLPRG